MAKKNEKLTEKKFGLRSSAVRAAKQANLHADDYTIVEVETGIASKPIQYMVKTTIITDDIDDIADAGMTDLNDDTPEDKAALAAMRAPEIPKPAFKIVDVTEGEIDETEDDRVGTDFDPKLMEEELRTVVASRTSVKDAAGNVKVDTAKSVLPGTPKKHREYVHRSTVDSPTKLVWHIADEMIAKNPEVARKTVIAECVKQGIAFYTARTQYQQWLTAHRESEANATAANGKK
jgi:hypothetical protein